MKTHFLDVVVLFVLFESSLTENNDFLVKETSPPGTIIGKLKFPTMTGQLKSYSFASNMESRLRRLFGIRSEPDVLITTGMLDYETRKLYHLPIVARYEGSTGQFQSVTMTVTVRVMDENDNIPAIAWYNSIREIKENFHPPQTIHQFTVFDADAGNNGMVECQINQPDDYFTLVTHDSNNYSIVANKTFDRKTIRYYVTRIDIRVICSDLGTPPLKTMTVLPLNVRKVKDLPPKFAQKFYSAFIVENSPIHSVLLKVEAFDIDTTSQLEYSIDPPVKFAIIDPKNGTIYSSISFDKEMTDVYKLRVKVVDKSATGDGEESDTADVTIFIQDVNESPKLSDPRTFNIKKWHARTGTVIGQLRAFDEDVGKNGVISKFECSDCRCSDFYLTENGEIVLKHNLDNKPNETYSLTVTVRDMGQPSLDSGENQIFINVEDPDWNCPMK